MTRRAPARRNAHANPTSPSPEYGALPGAAARRHRDELRAQRHVRDVARVELEAVLGPGQHDGRVERAFGVGRGVRREVNQPEALRPARRGTPAATRARPDRSTRDPSLKCLRDAVHLAGSVAERGKLRLARRRVAEDQERLARRPAPGASRSACRATARSGRPRLQSSSDAWIRRPGSVSKFRPCRTPSGTMMTWPPARNGSATGSSSMRIQPIAGGVLTRDSGSTSELAIDCWCARTSFVDLSGSRQALAA